MPSPGVVPLIETPSGAARREGKRMALTPSRVTDPRPLLVLSVLCSKSIASDPEPVSRVAPDAILMSAFPIALAVDDAVSHGVVGDKR